MIWLTYFEIMVSKIWKNEKFIRLTTKATIKSAHKHQNNIISEQKDLIPPATLTDNDKYDGNNDIMPTTNKIIKDTDENLDLNPAKSSELEIQIPDEYITSSPVFANIKGYMGKESVFDEVQIERDKGISFKKVSSSKFDELKLKMPSEADEIEKMRRWYKIQHFYNNYNSFIKLNWILHTDVYFELLSLGILLWSYNLLSTISSLLYLLVIGVLCLYKSGSKILFYKNFCLILFNVKYMCFLVFFHILQAKDGENNLADFIGNDKTLPSSYFSIGISNEEFQAFLLLFLILFLLEIYVIMNLKIVRYVSKQLQKSIKDYLMNYGTVAKLLDYESWENKSERFFIDLQGAFFSYFDRVVILSVGFFSISEYFFFNLMIFCSTVMYVFIVEFQTKWELLSNLEFKSKYFKYLIYLSFVALIINHFLLIPQISQSCGHFICRETGSRADKLYNIFILQTFLTLMSLKFYGDFPEYSKMQAFRVFFSPPPKKP